MVTLDFLAIAEQFPPVIARKEVGRVFGGIISPKTLANHDALGTGPRHRYQVNGHVVYRREDLLTWLNEQIGNLARRNHA